MQGSKLETQLQSLSDVPFDIIFHPGLDLSIIQIVHVLLQMLDLRTAFLTHYFTSSWASWRWGTILEFKSSSFLAYSWYGIPPRGFEWFQCRSWSSKIMARECRGGR